MKFTLSVLLLLFYFGISHAQSSLEHNIQLLDTEIKKAVAQEDYSKAAELKKEKSVWLELKAAIQNEDYSQAAILKKQLSNSFSETK